MLHNGPMRAATDRDRKVQPKPRDGGGRRTLWSAVYQDLQRRIRAGDFPEDFPGELELSEHYGVSRSTIRAALVPLRREGLVEAGPGRPSRVVHVSREHRYGPMYSLFAAVEATGMTQRSEIQASRLCKNPEVAKRLELDPDSDLVYLCRLRFADDEPIAVDQVWLAPEARDVLTVDLRDTALYEALRRSCDLVLTDGQETLHAILLSSDQARRLSCDAGSAAFYIERIGRVTGRPLEWRETLIRGDRFTVTTSYP